MKEFEQNEIGNIFSLAYVNKGNFNVMVFDKFNIISELNVNELLKIDSSTISLNGIPDP